MKNEKLALVALVIVILLALTAFIVINFGGDLFKEAVIIEEGDCCDVNYIGRYASNDTIFDSSYQYPENKSGGTPLNIFVSSDPEEFPPEGYETYYQRPEVGLMNGLVGLKEGETATIGPISPEDAYGVILKTGDIINLTDLIESTSVYEITGVQEGINMPPDLEPYFGNGTISLYTLRADWHYIGEILSEESPYICWENSSVVTKINETLLWSYITPSTDVGENFTWNKIERSEGVAMQTTYPENTSVISKINSSAIVVTHNPEIGTMIDVNAGMYGSASFVIENVTNDKINASITDPSTDEKAYNEFDRVTIIQRNETQNITIELPGEYLEQILSQLRMMHDNFYLSLDPLAGETLYYDVEIVKVYKTSQDQEES